jgi:hypothetical protein
VVGQGVPWAEEEVEVVEEAAVEAVVAAGS